MPNHHHSHSHTTQDHKHTQASHSHTHTDSYTYTNKGGTGSSTRDTSRPTHGTGLPPEKTRTTSSIGNYKHQLSKLCKY